MFGLARRGGEVQLQVLHVREGRADRRLASTPFSEVELDDAEVMARSSASTTAANAERQVPAEVLVSLEPADDGALEALLSERAGRQRDGARAAARSAPRELVALALRNAEAALDAASRRARERGRRRARAAGGARPRARCRAGSSATTSRTWPARSRSAAASCSRTASRPRPTTGATACARPRPATTSPACARCSRAGSRSARASRCRTCSWWTAAAGSSRWRRRCSRTLGIELDHIGLAKERDAESPSPRVKRSGGLKAERVFLPGRLNPVLLPPSGRGLLLLQRVRDEAHRFAISFQRELRRRAGLTSILEEIPGIGPGKRKSLLRELGSLKRVREASLEALARRARPLAPRRRGDPLLLRRGASRRVSAVQAARVQAARRPEGATRVEIGFHRAGRSPGERRPARFRPRAVRLRGCLPVRAARHRSCSIRGMSAHPKKQPARPSASAPTWSRSITCWTASPRSCASSTKRSRRSPPTWCVSRARRSGRSHAALDSFGARRASRVASHAAPAAGPGPRRTRLASPAGGATSERGLGRRLAGGSATQGLALGVVAPARVRVAAALFASLAAGGAASARAGETARAIRLSAPVEAVVEARVAAVTGVPPAARSCSRSARGGAARAARPGADPGSRSSPGPRTRCPGAPGAGCASRCVSHPFAGARIRADATPRVRSAAAASGRSRARCDPLLRAEIAAPAARGGLDTLARARRRGAERLAARGAGRRPAGGARARGGGGARREPAARSRAGRALAPRRGLGAASLAGRRPGVSRLCGAAAAQRVAGGAGRHAARRRAGALVAGAAYAVFTGLAAPVQRALVFLLLLAVAQLARRRLVRAGGVRGGGARRRRGRSGGALRARRTALVRRHRGTRVERPGTGARRPRPAAAARAGLVAALRVSASATAATAPLVALHFGWSRRSAGSRTASRSRSPRSCSCRWRSRRVVLRSSTRRPTAGRWRSASRARRSSGTSRSPRWRGSRRRRRRGRASRRERSASPVRRAWPSPASARDARGCASGSRCSPRPHRRSGPRPRSDRRRRARCSWTSGRATPRSCRGATGSVLVDGGVAVPERFDAGERVVVPALGALGVAALDLVVASHADLDHAGGLPAVLRAVPVRRLWLPPGGRAEPAFAALVELAHAQGRRDRGTRRGGSAASNR